MFTNDYGIATEAHSVNQLEKVSSMSFVRISHVAQIEIKFI